MWWGVYEVYQKQKKSIFFITSVLLTHPFGTKCVDFHQLGFCLKSIAFSISKSEAVLGEEECLGTDCQRGAGDKKGNCHALEKIHQEEISHT